MIKKIVETFWTEKVTCSYNVFISSQLKESTRYETIGTEDIAAVFWAVNSDEHHTNTKLINHIKIWHEINFNQEH